MAANRSRCAELARAVCLAAGALVLVSGALPGRAVAREPLRDAPVVWYEDDQRALEHFPAERDPNLAFDYFNESVFRPLGFYLDPVRNIRRLLPGMEKDPDSPNVNALGEVPNSSWFTNRIGLFPLSPEQVARGPNTGRGPSREGPWRVVAAKTAGVTPGFTVQDVHGERHLVKFVPKDYSVMPTAAGVISQRLLHAIGYWVPEDDIVHFRREDLVVADDVRIALPDGTERAMTEDDLDAILAQVEVQPDGRIRALASKFVPGQPIGPFDFEGRRDDDPNDTVEHHHRRELRGLRVFAEWLNHFDVKQQNSLDVLVTADDGTRHVRHYLIDFASTLGTGANGPIHKWGWEATIDPRSFLRRTLTLGLREDDYRKIERPAGLDEIGWFESEHFTPRGYAPPMPNPAFARINVRDGYWAAKILSAFTDEHLRAAVLEGEYRDPRATEVMWRILAARRDRIARAWFDLVAPLDFFVHEAGQLRFSDLGHERGLYPEGSPRYRARVSACDAERRSFAVESWQMLAQRRISLDGASVHDAPLAAFPFVCVEVQVDRGDGDWSPSVHAFVARRSGRVVEVRRESR